MLDVFQQRLMRWPGVGEDVKWSTQHCFLVGGRIFFMFSLDDPYGSVTFAASKEEQAEWIGLPGCRAAPYLGRAGWVTADPGALPLQTVLRAAGLSWTRVATKLSKKEREAYGVDLRFNPEDSFVEK